MLPAAQTDSSAAADREAITAAYSAWVDTIAARDLENWSFYLAPDAKFFPPDHSALPTREEILEYYAELFRDPLFALQCKLKSVEIADSGDVAWANGVCAATFTGPDGEEAHGSSKWVKVWRKQPSGAWKCAINIWNSSVPSSD
jgi:uncharacterized protein (TIGR02246 family)